jgi:hypothetical protein
MRKGRPNPGMLATRANVARTVVVAAKRAAFSGLEKISMTRSEKVICAVYAAIAVIALVATWSNNIAFMLGPENQNAWSFLRALYANGATASITNDLLLYALAGSVFMVLEARRLQVRHVWVYILLSLLIAVSVMFPLFLIARQVKMSQQRMPQSAVERSTTTDSSP